jgi:hypothetical protein
MEKNSYKGFIKILKDGKQIDERQGEFAIEDNCIIINENLVIPMHNICYFNISKNNDNSSHNCQLFIMVANWANI